METELQKQVSHKWLGHYNQEKNWEFELRRYMKVNHL